MMLFEQSQSPQSLNTARVLGGIGELAGGQGMLVDCDGTIRTSRGI
jgi:hypothetical protein